MSNTGPRLTPSVGLRPIRLWRASTALKCPRIKDAATWFVLLTQSLQGLGFHFEQIKTYVSEAIAAELRRRDPSKVRVVKASKLSPRDQFDRIDLTAK